MEGIGKMQNKSFSFIPSQGGSKEETLAKALAFYESLEDVTWHSWFLFVDDRLYHEGSFSQIEDALNDGFHPDLKQDIRLNYQCKPKKTYGPIKPSFRFVKRTTLSIDQIVNDKEECPLPVSVIPNHMGINLCAVKHVTWDEQEDGQILSLTIQFLPSDKP